MASFEYTPAQITEMENAGPLNAESAQMFADKFGATVHSVRAKAVRTETIGYTKKSKARKDGSPVESKAEIVSAIATLLGSDAESFESLGNATRIVLVAVRNALADAAEVAEGE